MDAAHFAGWLALPGGARAVTIVAALLRAPLFLVVGLALAGCSTPNPGWVDTEATGVASGGSSGGSGEATSATSGVGSTSGSSAGSSGGVSVGESSSGGDVSASGTSTGGVGDLCGDFVGAVIQVDGILDQATCEKGIEGYGRVSNNNVDPPAIEICLFPQCGVCTGIFIELDPEANWLADGTCLTGQHEGIWLPGDPEAPQGCKTTGFLLYDGDAKYPVYMASSRVFDPPKDLDGALGFGVKPVNQTPCTCDPAGCCEGDVATLFDLEFDKDGNALTVTPGAAAVFPVGDAFYIVQALRGYARGYEAEGACHGEIDFVDWQMVRLGP